MDEFKKTMDSASKINNTDNVRNVKNKNNENNINDLQTKTCKPCEGGVPSLTEHQLQNYLQQLTDWKLMRGSKNLTSNSVDTSLSNKLSNNSNNMPGNANNRSNNVSTNNLKCDYIYRDFEFKNYYKTMAFVNAVAWVSHQENHHPDLEVGYNRCRVKYSTHAIGGLSENDFICAAKIDALGNV